jgi:hypothetical protein
VSQARHWCEYCRIYINGTKPSIAFHENGKKHKEIVETFLRDMRKRGRERRIEKSDVEKELAKIEREAMKQHMREDVVGMGARSAGPALSADHAARLAALEEQMAHDKQLRTAGSTVDSEAGSELLRAGWEAGTNPDGKTFYTHLETGAMQWEWPRREGEAAELPSGWEAGTNPDGKTFYTHSETGAVQWERPRRPAASPKASFVAMPPGGSFVGWEQGWTAEGIPYYFNTDKALTQWEPPEGWGTVDAAEAAAVERVQAAEQCADGEEGADVPACGASAEGAVGEGDRSSGSTEPSTGLGIHSAVDTVIAMPGTPQLHVSSSARCDTARSRAILCPCCRIRCACR